jgi:uncharacterized protein YacL
LSRGRKIFLLILGVLGATAFSLFAPFVFQTLFYLVRGGKDEVYLRTTSDTIGIIGLGVLGLIVGIGIARLLLWLRDLSDDKWQTLETGDKVTLFLGTFVGLVAAMPFLVLLNTMQLGIYIPLAFVGLTLGFGALSVYALRSMEDVLPWYRGGRSRGKRRGIRILDTNVLIDGRIYDVARTGFLEGSLYVPGFVLDELQYIADSHDALRRQRGRRGLDVLRHLQADFPTEVRTHDKLAPDLGDEVDARLVRLARALGADIVTNDFNLNRVAAIQDVKVLNLNDLALSLRPTVLPREGLTLSLIREGNQPGQGVGYLEDGTMVVVDNGKNFIGETREVIVTQVIQTERGKMIFAEINEEEDHLNYDAVTQRKTSTRRPS